MTEQPAPTAASARPPRPVRITSQTEQSLRRQVEAYNRTARLAPRATLEMLKVVYTRGAACPSPTTSGHSAGMNRVKSFLSSLANNSSFTTLDADLFPSRAPRGPLWDAALAASSMGLDEVKALLTRASLTTYSDPTRAFYLNRALALVASGNPLARTRLEDALRNLVADGNSRAARSLRAKTQLRDRKGRWIEMGRGVRFKVRKPGAPGGGTWFHGKVEGVDVPNGRVNVRLEDGRLVAVPHDKMEQPKAIIRTPQKARLAPGVTPSPSAHITPGGPAPSTIGRNVSGANDRIEKLRDQRQIAFRARNDAEVRRIDKLIADQQALLDGPEKTPTSSRAKPKDVQAPVAPPAPEPAKPAEDEAPEGEEPYDADAPIIARLDDVPEADAIGQVAAPPADSIDMKEALDDAAKELRARVSDDSSDAATRNMVLENVERIMDEWQHGDPETSDGIVESKESAVEQLNNAANFAEEYGANGDSPESQAFKAFAEDVQDVIASSVDRGVPIARLPDAAPATPRTPTPAPVQDIDAFRRRAPDAGAPGGLNGPLAIGQTEFVNFEPGGGELAALENYAFNLHWGINNVLRDPKFLDDIPEDRRGAMREQMDDNVDVMKGLLSRSKLKNEVNVYRGIIIEDARVRKQFTKVGNVITDDGFVSTTTEEHEAIKFTEIWGGGGQAKNVMLNITVPAGSNALDVDALFEKYPASIEHLGGESEFILPPGGQFRITGAYKEEGHWEVDAEYIGNLNQGDLDDRAGNAPGPYEAPERQQISGKRGRPEGDLVDAGDGKLLGDRSLWLDRSLDAWEDSDELVEGARIVHLSFPEDRSKVLLDPGTVTRTRYFDERLGASVIDVHMDNGRDAVIAISGPGAFVAPAPESLQSAPEAAAPEAPEAPEAPAERNVGAPGAEEFTALATQAQSLAEDLESKPETEDRLKAMGNALENMGRKFAANDLSGEEVGKALQSVEDAINSMFSDTILSQEMDPELEDILNDFQEDVGALRHKVQAWMGSPDTTEADVPEEAPEPVAPEPEAPEAPDISAMLEAAITEHGRKLSLADEIKSDLENIKNEVDRGWPMNNSDVAVHWLDDVVAIFRQGVENNPDAFPGYDKAADDLEAISKAIQASRPTPDPDIPSLRDSDPTPAPEPEVADAPEPPAAPEAEVPEGPFDLEVANQLVEDAINSASDLDNALGEELIGDLSNIRADWNREAYGNDEIADDLEGYAVLLDVIGRGEEDEDLVAKYRNSEDQFRRAADFIRQAPEPTPDAPVAEDKDDQPLGVGDLVLIEDGRIGRVDGPGDSDGVEVDIEGNTYWIPADQLHKMTADELEEKGMDPGGRGGPPAPPPAEVPDAASEPTADPSQVSDPTGIDESVDVPKDRFGNTVPPGFVLRGERSVRGQTVQVYDFDDPDNLQSFVVEVGQSNGEPAYVLFPVFGPRRAGAQNFDSWDDIPGAMSEMRVADAERRANDRGLRDEQARQQAADDVRERIRIGQAQARNAERAERNVDDSDRPLPDGWTRDVMPDGSTVYRGQGRYTAITDPNDPDNLILLHRGAAGFAQVGNPVMNWDELLERMTEDRRQRANQHRSDLGDWLENHGFALPALDAVAHEADPAAAQAAVEADPAFAELKRLGERAAGADLRQPGEVADERAWNELKGLLQNIAEIDPAQEIPLANPDVWNVRDNVSMFLGDVIPALELTAVDAFLNGDEAPLDVLGDAVRTQLANYIRTGLEEVQGSTLDADDRRQLMEIGQAILGDIDVDQVNIPSLNWETENVSPESDPLDDAQVLRDMIDDLQIEENLRENLNEFAAGDGNALDAWDPQVLAAVATELETMGADQNFVDSVRNAPVRPAAPESPSPSPEPEMPSQASDPIDDAGRLADILLGVEDEELGDIGRAINMTMGRLDNGHITAERAEEEIGQARVAYYRQVRDDAGNFENDVLRRLEALEDALLHRADEEVRNQPMDDGDTQESLADWERELLGMDAERPPAPAAPAVPSPDELPADEVDAIEMIRQTAAMLAPQIGTRVLRVLDEDPANWVTRLHELADSEAAGGRRLSAASIRNLAEHVNEARGANRGAPETPDTPYTPPAPNNAPNGGWGFEDIVDRLGLTPEGRQAVIDFADGNDAALDQMPQAVVHHIAGLLNAEGADTGLIERMLARDPNAVYQAAIDQAYPERPMNTGIRNFLNQAVNGEFLVPQARALWGDNYGEAAQSLAQSLVQLASQRPEHHDALIEIADRVAGAPGFETARINQRVNGPATDADPESTPDEGGIPDANSPDFDAFGEEPSREPDEGNQLGPNTNAELAPPPAPADPLLAVPRPARPGGRDAAPRGYHRDGVIRDRNGNEIYAGLRVRAMRDGQVGIVVSVQQEPAYARIEWPDGRRQDRAGRQLVNIDPRPAGPGAAPAAPAAPGAPAAPAVQAPLDNALLADRVDDILDMHVQGAQAGWAQIRGVLAARTNIEAAARAARSGQPDVAKREITEAVHNYLIGLQDPAISQGQNRLLKADVERRLAAARQLASEINAGAIVDPNVVVPAQVDEDLQVANALRDLIPGFPPRQRMARGAGAARNLNWASMAANDVVIALNNHDRETAIRQLFRAQRLFRDGNRPEFAAQLEPLRVRLENAPEFDPNAPVDPDLNNPIMPGDFLENRFNLDRANRVEQPETPGVKDPRIEGARPDGDNRPTPEGVAPLKRDAKQIDYQGWKTRAGEILAAAQTRPKAASLFKLSGDELDDAAKAAFGDNSLGVVFGHGGRNGNDPKKLFNVRFTSASKSDWDGESIAVNFSIYNQEGTRVGSVSRTLKKNGDVLSAYNASMSTGVGKGGGFATGFNRYMENWYIANGFKHVDVSAAGGGGYTGGFVWAMNGFGWNAGRPKDVANKMLDKFGRANAADKEQVAALRARNAAGDVPTPMEIAMVGWRPGMGGADEWAGKKVMTQQNWAGRKVLTPENVNQQQRMAYDFAKNATDRIKAGVNVIEPMDEKLAQMLGNASKFKDLKLSKLERKEFAKLVKDGKSVALLSPRAKRRVSDWAIQRLRKNKVSEYESMRFDMDEIRRKMEADLGADYPVSDSLGVGEELRDLTMRQFDANNTPGWNFRKLSLGEGGQSQTYMVTHTSTGQIFFAKQDTLADRRTGIPGVARNMEKDVNTLFRRLGFAGIGVNETSRADGSMVIMERIGDNMNLVSRPVNSDQLNAAEATEAFKNLANPEDAFKMLIGDALGGNVDRHYRNYMMAKDRDSKWWVFPVDQGLFGSGGGWRSNNPANYIQTTLMDSFRSKIYTSGVRKWAKTAGRDQVRFMVQNIASSYREALGGGGFIDPNFQRKLQEQLDVLDGQIEEVVTAIIG